MELTVTNRSRAYPGRSSEDSKVDGVQYVVLKVCCARVAQWWSIALPRRGSRVRIPSRALKEIEKESSDGWLFFLCSSPAGLERFECLRSAPVVAGERPPDVLRRLVLSIRCEKEEISDGYLLFFSHVRALLGSNGSKSTLRCGRRNNFKYL